MERGKVLAGSLQLLDGSTSRDNNFCEVMLILNSIDHGVNPFRNWATVTDCGDISNTPFDKLVAIRELEHGMKSINSLKPKNVSSADAVRLITIGGDHTISNY
jgi:arginase family enzyme